MISKSIPFSPPDITEEEVKAVSEVLRSGWITTGPKVAEFEKQIKNYCSVEGAVALNSNTAGFEVINRFMDLKSGDEVITTPYTYTATSSPLVHRGIKPKFVDVEKDSFLIDVEKLHDAITDKTKVIITVDVAGVPVDYDEIKAAVKDRGREDIVLISDSAHSFGASYKGKKVGSQFDFHNFSFHAVKNLTTAEGGALTFNNNNFHGSEDLTRLFKLISLQGQSKDAFSKTKAGAWQYDILFDGLKCNMTDIMAAIGLVQLNRYEDMLKKRKAIFELYTDRLKDKEWAVTPFQKDDIKETSYHLYPLRLKGFTEEQRNRVISDMAKKDIATNVHFTPLPMFTLFKNLGYKIEDYPNAYAQYANEITLPLYSILSLENAEYVVTELIRSVENTFNK